MGNAMVAVCDILGFSSLIKEKPLDSLLGGEFALFRELLDYSLKQGDRLPDLPPNLAKLRDQGRVGFAWFSDTVLIYSKNDDDDSCFNVIVTVYWLVWSTILSRTKLRAGIGYGEFLGDPDNELFLGEAVVDAYELEQAQEWVGAALTPKAAQRLPRDTYGWPLRDYEVPLKMPASRECCSNIAVDWAWGSYIDLKWSPDAESPSAEDWCKRRSICTKWRNTQAFYSEVYGRPQTKPLRRPVAP